MTLELRNKLVSDRVVGVEAALIQMGLGRNAKDAALAIRVHLIDLLPLLDRNTRLDTAADDLHRNAHLAFDSFRQAQARGRMSARRA